MSLAVQIRQHGGPEELHIVDVPVCEPGPGEVRIRHHAIGLNFIDVYHRTGLYPLSMPATIGMEGAGVIEAVGEGVTHLKVGDRAAYASNPPGAYCEVRVMPAKCVCKLPDAISFETGAAMMLKGLTAQYLLKKTRRHRADHLPRHHQWLARLGRGLLRRLACPSKPLIERGRLCHRAHSVRMVQPVVLRASRSRWACCTSASG